MSKSRTHHPRYHNTGFVGHTFPTKTIDSKSACKSLSFATPASTTPSPPTPNTLAASAGATFDYKTLDNCGSGDRICCHGVMDIFCTPKFAAGFYKSMCEPSEEIVLEPAFH